MEAASQEPEKDPIAEKLHETFAPHGTAPSDWPQNLMATWLRDRPAKGTAQATPKPDIMTVFSASDARVRINHVELDSVEGIHYQQDLETKRIKGRLVTLVNGQTRFAQMLSQMSHEPLVLSVSMANEYGDVREMRLHGVKFIKREASYTGDSLYFQDVFYFTADDLTE